MKATAISRTWAITGLVIILFALLALAVAVAAGYLSRSAGASLSDSFGRALSQESVVTSEPPAAAPAVSASATDLTTPALLDAAPLPESVRTVSSGSRSTAPASGAAPASAPAVADAELAAGRAAAAANAPLPSVP